MQRRDFLRSVIVGTLAAPFVTRQAQAKYAVHPRSKWLPRDGEWVVFSEHDRFEYRLTANLGRNRQYRCIVSFEPGDDLRTIRGKFANARHSMLTHIELDGHDMAEISRLINAEIYAQL